MEFPESIVEMKEGKYAYRCLYCNGIDCLDRENGEYVRTGSKDAEYSGYFISQLEDPWISAD